jgi:hypothetical protein
MWIRVRTATFVVTSLAVFVAVAATLAWLLTGYLAAVVVRAPTAAALHRVVAAVAVAGLGLTALLVVQIGAHALSRRSTRGAIQATAHWGERWMRAAEGGPMPDGPLDAAAADALARLRDAVRGDSAVAFEDLYERSGLLIGDLDTAARGRGIAKVGAIERLAMMRHPASLESLVRLASTRDPVVSRLGRRAAVRTLAGGRVDAGRATRAGLRLLDDARVGSGEATELLLLLDGAATPLLRELLRPATLRPRHVRIAALDAVGRSGRIDLAVHVASWLHDPEPELRAAALRAFRWLEHVPPQDEEAVLEALADPVPFVRTQAAGACVALRGRDVRGALWGALADPDRWVRRTAASTLAAFGSDGRETLRQAAREHPDRFGRDVAAEVLAWS